MRRPVLQWAVLAAVGVAAVAMVAVLGPPDGDTDQASSTTARQGDIGLVGPEELTQACSVQLGGSAEAVWVSSAWLCAGVRGGLWGTEELDVVRVCAGAPQRSTSASGVGCG